jgi:hypothetical protein
MLESYGDKRGFSWTLGAIIGAQLLTVPVSQEFNSIYELVAIFSSCWSGAQPWSSLQ